MCDCIAETNKLLAEHNGTLVTTLFGNPQRCTVGTDKADSKKRGRAPFMLASFCPFCGEKYAKAESSPSQGEAA